MAEDIVVVYRDNRGSYRWRRVTADNDIVADGAYAHPQPQAASDEAFRVNRAPYTLHVDGSDFGDCVVIDTSGGVGPSSDTARHIIDSVHVRHPGQPFVVAGMALAPFTAEQVASLNDYQTSGVAHPFTCRDDSGHGPLRADITGFVCDTCPYRQNWAHAHMADGSRRVDTRPIVTRDA